LVFRDQKLPNHIVARTSLAQLDLIDDPLSEGLHRVLRGLIRDRTRGGVHDRVQRFREVAPLGPVETEHVHGGRRRNLARSITKSARPCLMKSSMQRSIIERMNGSSFLTAAGEKKG
jgi:hypothetical protein